MCRVKGVYKEEKIPEGGTRLPRAVFEKKMDDPGAIRLHHLQVQCPECAMVVYKSNLSRHTKSRHPSVLECPVSESELSSSQGSSIASSPGRSARQVAQVAPVSPTSPQKRSLPRDNSPQPGDVPAARKVPKLLVNQPATVRALGKKTTGSRDVRSAPGLQGLRDDQLDQLDHLPPTPQTDEELSEGLAKLYSGTQSQGGPDSVVTKKTVPRYLDDPAKDNVKLWISQTVCRED